MGMGMMGGYGGGPDTGLNFRVQGLRVSGLGFRV